MNLCRSPVLFFRFPSEVTGLLEKEADMLLSNLSEEIIWYSCLLSLKLYRIIIYKKFEKGESFFSNAWLCGSRVRAIIFHF